MLAHGLGRMTSFDAFAWVLRALAAASSLLLSLPTTAADMRNVLVLYSNNRLVPGNVSVDRGLRSVVTSPTDRPIVIFSEFLDAPDFGGEAFEKTFTAYLREKYSLRPPSALVAVNEAAFDFLMRHRSQLFPNTPLVHTVVSKSHLRTGATLPADVLGVPIEYDYSGTIEQALRWHPTARRLVVVTGSSPIDLEREARLRREVPAVSKGVNVEFVAGLSTASVLQLLRSLNNEAVVFTPGYFRDGEGQLFSPRDSAALMAAASTAPVYGPVDTFIGTGVVGGRMPSFEEAGRLAAQLVSQLLAEAPPSSLQVADIVPNALRVDWRQIRRWGIDENLLPPDTVVYFRDPSFWGTYGDIAIVVAAVMLLQSALIAMLLFERRRRRTAELALQKQHAELTHVSRLAVAGELTASIAHEINQPLGAVQTSADAADLILHAGGDRREDLLRIVTRIRRDSMRASDVIRRLRTLLAKHEPEKKPFDLNTAVSDVSTLLQGEAHKRQTTLDARPAKAEVSVAGDQTQIQQVLINLALNAMDAVADAPTDRRVVSMSVQPAGPVALVTVRDKGHGIETDQLSKVFESFFSTKHRGMGLGLSIARSVVEAHGGRIWAENGDDFGAVFYVELPRRVDAVSAPNLQ